MFRQRGRGGKGEETSMCGRHLHAPPLGTWPASKACAMTGNRTGSLSGHRPMLNPMSYTSQGCFSIVKHIM